MSMTMNQCPDNCPECGGPLNGDGEELDGDRIYIYEVCERCGAHVVNTFAHVESEVYTKKEWEE